MEMRNSFHSRMRIWVISPAKPQNPADILAESKGILEWLVEERVSIAGVVTCSTNLPF